MESKFHIRCSKCLEPQTTYVFVKATRTRYGTTCRIGITCVVCGTREEITDKVFQISFNDFIEEFE